MFHISKEYVQWMKTIKKYDLNNEWEVMIRIQKYTCMWFYPDEALYVSAKMNRMNF